MLYYQMSVPSVVSFRNKYLKLYFIDCSARRRGSGNYVCTTISHLFMYVNLLWPNRVVARRRLAHLRFVNNSRSCARFGRKRNVCVITFSTSSDFPRSSLGWRTGVLLPICTDLGVAYAASIIAAMSARARELSRWNKIARTTHTQKPSHTYIVLCAEYVVRSTI